MNDQVSPEQRAYMDRIYERELELIKQGQDPETAHAVAVAEDTLTELEQPDDSRTKP
jgi:hypothetical protein